MRALRRFLEDRAGVTAVEFALVGPLFLALALTSFEGGGLMVRSMLLDRSVDKAVRQVRVKGGTATISQNDFRTAVCNGMIILKGACSSSLVVEMTVVKSATSFPTNEVVCATKAAPNPTVSYSMGARSDMVYVRACLAVDPMLPLIAGYLGLPRNASGGYDVVATAGFMNEP